MCAKDNPTPSKTKETPRTSISDGFMTIPYVDLDEVSERARREQRRHYQENEQMFEERLGDW